MKRTIIVFSMLGGFLALSLIYGYSLPVEHQISLSKHYDKTPDELWRVLINYRKYAEWRENVYEVIELESKNYDAWKEVDAQGHSIMYQITGHSPSTQLIVETNSAEVSYSGSLTFDLVPENNGTTLKITEKGRIYNLFLRVITHLFRGYSSDMQAWLRSLENKFVVDEKRIQSVETAMSGLEQSPEKAVLSKEESKEKNTTEEAQASKKK